MRWIIVCLIVGAGYWYYSGMERAGEDQVGGIHDESMRKCMADKRYTASRTGTSDARAQDECAQELDLYRDGGHWYSYSEVRR